LPARELERDWGASYPSLLPVFVPSLDAMNFGVERASNVFEAPTSAPDRGPDLSRDDVRRYAGPVRAELDRLLARLSERHPDRAFRVPQRPPSFPHDLTLSVRDLLWHLVEEELQHRAELNTLRWQIDVNPPLFGWVADSSRAPREDGSRSSRGWEAGGT
jgi:uncharacterized damage-inducible protein DinB